MKKNRTFGSKAILNDRGEFTQHLTKASTALMPMATALGRIANNTNTFPDKLSFLDFE